MENACNIESLQDEVINDYNLSRVRGGTDLEDFKVRKVLSERFSI